MVFNSYIDIYFKLFLLFLTKIILLRINFFCKKLNNSNTSKNSKKSNFSNMKYRTLGNDEWKHYNTNIRKSFHPNKFPQHLAKSDWEKNLTWNRNEYKRGFNKYTLKKN